MGELASALPMYERTLAILEKALGSEHPEVAKTLGNLSRLHRSLGRPAEALALGERALALGEKALGPDHPGLVANLNNLANVHYDEEDYVRAKALYERGLSIREKALGPDHPEVGVSLGNLANLYLVIDEPQQALALAERAATIFAAHPDQQPRANELRFILAQALVAAHGDRDRALAEARKARDGFRAGTGSAQELAAVEQWLAKHELARD
jgi:tetratricopeptide (TPR) repeat protein